MIEYVQLYLKLSIPIDQIIDMFETDKRLMEEAHAIGYNLKKGYVRKRIRHVKSSGEVWIRKKENQEIVKATSRLIIRLSKTGIDPYQKVQKYIEIGSSRLGFSTVMKRRALTIAQDVNYNPLLASRDYQVIVASIINLIRHNFSPVITKTRIAQAFDTNTNAINQVSGIIHGILTRNRT